MKIQEVILRAISKQMNWLQAAEIIVRRWKRRYEEHGYDGLYDRHLKRPSPRRAPLKTVERVLALYRERYFDFNVMHFVEKLHREHEIALSYSWVKKALGSSVRAQIPYGTKQLQALYHQRTAAERSYSRLLTITIHRGWCR